MDLNQFSMTDTNDASCGISISVSIVYSWLFLDKWSVVVWTRFMMLVRCETNKEPSCKSATVMPKGMGMFLHTSVICHASIDT